MGLSEYPADRTLRERPWLRVYRPRPQAPMRLICFHHAGGGALAYRRWPDLIGDTVEVAAVQLPGREDRFSERPQDDIEAILDALLGALATDSRPYALFGHSLGGLLAYRLALRLHVIQSRLAPQHLLVSAARPPISRLRAAAPAQELTDAYLIEQLARLGGTPEGFFDDPGLLQPFLPSLRADYLLARRAVLPEAPMLDVPLTVLGGEQDPTIRAEDLADWRRLSRGSFAVRTFPGGHFYLAERPGAVVAAIATALAPKVTNAGASSSKTAAS